MKLRKEIIVTCCVLIASFGIVLTGCGNGSGEKKEEKYVESNSEKNTETNNGKNVENNAEKSTQSNTDKNVDSNNSKDAEKLYVGTWEAKVVEYDAEEIIQASEFIFHADGTGKFIGDDGGEGLKLDIEWEPTEDGLKFTDYGGEGYFTYKDGKLLMDVELQSGGSTTAHFEKQK